MALGNSDAVKEANTREAKTRARRAPEGNPAQETAAAARPEAPEEKRGVPERELTAEEEFEARLRASIPGLTDDALEGLKKLFLH